MNYFLYFGFAWFPINFPWLFDSKMYLIPFIPSFSILFLGAWYILEIVLDLKFIKNHKNSVCAPKMGKKMSIVGAEDRKQRIWLKGGKAWAESQRRIQSWTTGPFRWRETTRGKAGRVERLGMCNAGESHRTWGIRNGLKFHLVQ